MIPLRQHIASLIAVFFFLLIGILVGAALSGFPGEKQGILLRRIELRIKRLLEENRRLIREMEEMKTTLEAKEKIEEQLVPYIADYRLSGRGIVIAWFGKPISREDVLSAINRAGAKVIGEVEVKEGMREVGREMVGKLERILEIGSPSLKDTPPRRVAHFLGVAIIKGVAPRVLGLLRREGVIRHEGTFGAPADTLLIIHTRPSRREGFKPEVEEGLVKGTRGRGGYVVASETTKIPELLSFVPFYRRLGVSTVDNVDTASGRISLLLVLEGRKGHFGVKSTAEGFLPPAGVSE